MKGNYENHWLEQRTINFVINIVGKPPQNQSTLTNAQFYVQTKKY